MSLSLITDRTQADYNLWLTLSEIPWDDMTDEQKAVWSVPMKGAYNYTDLNRVGGALQALQAVFNSYGYSVAANVRTDWMAGEWPTQAEMDAYIQAIKNIRSAVTVLSTTPAAPDSMDDGTVTIWNNIEKILLDADILINSLRQIFIHSNQKIVNCGSLMVYLPMQTYTLCDKNGVVLCDSNGAILKV